MISLAESILSSTHTGKNSFDLKPVHTKETEYQVNANMKDWFTCVSYKNFEVWVNHYISAAKTCSRHKDMWGRNFSTRMRFNDGYFLLYFFVQAFDGKIVYSFYFSENYSIDSVSKKYAQMKKIHKVDSEITNIINNYDSMKTCVQKIKGYICKYIDLIEKQ